MVTPTIERHGLVVIITLTTNIEGFNPICNDAEKPVVKGYLDAFSSLAKEFEHIYFNVDSDGQAVDLTFGFSSEEASVGFYCKSKEFIDRETEAVDVSITEKVVVELK